MTAEAETVVAPVVRTVRVACSQERAFRVFTEVGSWWPLDQYSIGEDRAESVMIEPRVGGRIVESIAGGETAEWGSVLAWEPFDRLVLEWRVRPEKPATEVEVTFTPDGDGTIVRLEHRHWERFGDAAAEARSGYDAGWQGLLDVYSEATGKADRKA
jgi:uncharacterized protein YndB with AHSA1/START domain